MGSALSTRQQVLDTLSAHGISGAEVYLLDAVPLIELAWADGEVHPAERAMILSFVEHLMVKLRAEAGYNVVTHAQALVFIDRLTTERPSRLDFSVWLQCLKTLRLSGKDRRARLDAIVEGMHAVGAVAPSPAYRTIDWDEREVLCFMRLESTLRHDD